MDAADVDRILRTCEAALGERARVDLGALGFWKAVAAVKRRPDLVDRYGERIARIDRAAFLRATPITVPAWLGVAVEAVGTAVGVVAVLLAPGLGAPWREAAYFIGMGALVGTTHALTHYVVGGLMGMRFTHFFSRPPRSPQPGFKTDYATYLRTPARQRAWMHASGAIVSKVIPFKVAALALIGGAEAWAVALLVAFGVLQLLTDALLSTRASDWKKFRREMRFAPR